MAKLQGRERAAGILRMEKAQRAGVSASAFIKSEQQAGRAYRRQIMLSDWRNVGNIKKKTGLLKYVRKGYYPSPNLYAKVDWDLTREYLYKLKVQTRLAPGEPITERFVNISSDRPLTPTEWENAIIGTSTGLEGSRPAEVILSEPILAVRRVS